MGIITASAALWLYNKYSQDNNDGKGIQVGEVKNPYIRTTSGDVNERESDELARQTIGTITKYGLSAGAMYLVKKVLENQKIQRNLRNYTEMSYLAESISGTTDDALNIFGGGRVTLTNLALNTARAFEELSPFSILRTFQTSHILQPFATKEAEFNFESDLLIRQKAYFEELFKTYGTRAFHTDDIINGLRYSKGKIIDAAGDTVIHNARLVTTEYKGISQGHDETSNYNRVFRRYISTQENLPHEAKRELFNLSKSIPDDRAPFTIMAAKQGESIETRWIKSAVSQAVSQGFNIVNEPLAFLEEMTGTMINKDNPVFRFVNRYGRINPHASQDARVADLALGYVRHGSMKLAALAAGYYALDNAAKVFGTEDSGYDKGILEGLATSAANAKLTYNRLISDRFEEYTEQQEYVAPGSTSLLRLAGFPLAGAMAGGLVSYAMRVTPSAIGGGYKESMRQAAALDDVISPVVSNAAKTTILSDALTGAARGRRYATRGALLASVFALPFLPGALMGESSDKAEAEYLYGEDVAIKRNRLWFCLHPDTQLLTNNGNKRADNISIGDKLMDRYGNYNRVMDISVRTAYEKVYDIRTVNTPCIPMKLTGEHEVLTPSGWKMAKHLSVGDKVIAPIPAFNDNNNTLHPIEYLDKDRFVAHNGYVKKLQLQRGGKLSPTMTGRIPDSIALDFSFGRLLGWFVAEGTMPAHLDNGLMEIAFHNSEAGFAEEVSRYIETITGKLPRLYKNQGNGKRIRFNSYCLFNLIKSILYRDGIKIVPDMTNFPKEVIRGFIVGMFYGDGTVSKKRGVRDSWSIKSQHIQNVLELRRYLSIFGVYGCIYIDSGSYKLSLGKKWSKIAHEQIGVYKELYRYEDSFCNRYSVNKSSTAFKDGFIEIEISGIDSFYYEGQVYDYTMENIHEYSATTFVVHNSGSSDIEGEGIKYFTKNWYQRIIAGNKDKILYGDGDTKDELNPFLSPFDYLRNPYRFEEMHKHDMPYPVWGMDISVGGWAGKIFEKSIGAIIKPDIINPALSEMPLESPQIEEGVTNVGMPSQGEVPQSGSVLWAGGGIHYPINYSNKESTLIAEGLLSPKRSATYNPEREAFNYTLNAMYDFTGLKGWMASNLVSGISPFTDNETNQIARSGEATNFAREFMSYNLGGLFGGADILRRIVPMSSEVMYNRVNPLVNQMAPSWLPRGSSYTDFSRGAYWDSVENGYDRLPGQGYEHYNPELKGISPEDYPDINKFEILSDVAYGSNEYYAINERMTALYQSGEMSEQDMAKFDEIYIQNQERARKRIFHEYKNDEDLEGVSLWGRVLNSVWETTTHNAELPTERLTFFRPAGKLLHQRTAIEDYKKTQLSEGDTALWTHPYKHFIRPFFSDSYRYLDSEHVATHVQERRNVDNYFDALEYYKQMRIYRDSVVSNPYAAEQAKRKAYKTTYGAVASGLDSSEEIQSAYASLSDNERMYFSSFVNARDSDRDDISRIVDGTNTRDMYNMLWARRDALANGDDIASITDEENERLIADNISAYRAYTSSGDQSIGISFREYLQEKRAESLIIEATGIPDEQFAGWDPRIDTKAIKLRALQLSKEDVREYGFWKSDEEELRRNLAVLEEDQVITQMSSIIRTRARRDFDISHTVKSEMIKRGIETSNIQVSNVGYGDTVINIS